MIEVTLKTKANEIVSIIVTGHANAGPHGDDLVCAGVSSIVFGGLNALEELQANKTSILVEDNRITIVVKQYDSELMLVLQTIMWQLRTIATEYKDFIRIKEV